MVTIGTDVEVFVQDDAGRIVPVCGKVGGTKARPKAMANGQFVQEDNVTLEINTNPTGCASDFLAQLRFAVENTIPDALKGTGLRPVYTTHTHTFKVPEVEFCWKQFTEIGCEPFLLGYSGEKVSASAVTAKQLVCEEDHVRYAGGHIHLGYRNTSQVPAWAVAVLCDLFLGIPSLGIDKQGHGVLPRSKFYGIPGSYRPKQYGIEYRRLSNFFLDPECDGEVKLRLAYNALRLADYVQNCPTQLKELYSITPWKEVYEIMQEESATRGVALIKSLNSEVINSGINIPHNSFTRQRSY